MGESTKAVCVVVFAAACLVTPLVWLIDQQPGPITWSFRLGCPVVGALAIGLLLILHFRADVVPDYLYIEVGKYFNRDGFCFAFRAVPVDGVCYLLAYFENQHDQPCRGRIVLRPARGFWLRRAKIENITFEINCEPAAFGFVRIVLPLAKELQGKRQLFDVGASAHYPNGQGRRLRFRDGVFLRTNCNFGDTFGTGLIVAGAVLEKPRKAKIELPVGVTEDVPEGLKPETRTLWRLGAPPLGVADPVTS